MSEFALVIPASRGYLIGLNGILNSLDMHGNTCAVEVVTDDIGDEYFDNARKTLDYPVNVHRIDEFPELRNDGWSMVRMLHFSRYALAARLAGEYEAIMLLDADCGLVNNVMQWFKMAGDSGLVLAAHNVLGLDSFRYEERHHTNAVPVANMPLFARPDDYQRVFERTIEISAGPGGIDDMPALYYALDEAGAVEKTVLLPDSLWLNNHFHQTQHTLNDHACWGGGRFYLYANRERVFAFHKRWWDRSYRERETARLDGEARRIADWNTRLWAQIYHRMNTRWKLKIDYAEYGGS